MIRRFLLPAWALAKREWVQFFRQPARVVGAVLTPLLFWLFLGSGMGSSFKSSDAGYLQYFFPGTILLVILFSAVFSSISLIEDRNQGFLQAALISPSPLAAIVAGKMLGATLISVAQAFVCLLLAPLVGIPLSAEALFLSIPSLALLAFLLSGLGLYFAWRIDSVQGFHSVMNLILFPLWFLSGALFPKEGAPEWVGWLMAANPLAYGLQLLRAVLKGGAESWAAPIALSLVLAVGFAILGQAVVKTGKPRGRYSRRERHT